MIRKWLYIFYSLSVLILIAYVAMIFLFSKENRKIVINKSSFFLQQNLIEEKYNELNIIKKTLTNEYNFLKKEYKNIQIKNLKKEIKSLERAFEAILLINKKDFLVYVNSIFTKTNFNFDLEILNKDKIVIASSDFFDIGKRVKLKCNPIENYGTCEIINDNFYYVKYMPNVKIYIVAKKHFSSPPKEYFNPLKLTLKSFPDIIVYNLKGKMDNKHFYIFDEFKPLKIFFGVGISYEDLESFPKQFTKNTSKTLFYRFLKLSFFMSLIMIIYLTISTYLLFKLRKLSKYIEKDLMYDKLTKLLNRKGFEKLYDVEKTLLMIDLDNFKYINDTFGHDRGDEVLKSFSNLLKIYFKGDVISRWGGDEFIVLTDKSKEKIKRIIEKINIHMQEIQKKFDKKQEKKLSISCGGSVGNKDKEIKFKEADLALYKIKKTTKMGCRFYDELDYVKIEEF